MGDADGHSHTEDDLPNSVDPLGGWLDSSTDYSSAGQAPTPAPPTPPGPECSRLQLALRDRCQTDCAGCDFPNVNVVLGQCVERGLVAAEALRAQCAATIGGGGRRQLQADTYHLWTKSVSGGDQGGVYILYHTVHLGWGYVYMVELVWSIDTVTVTDLHMEDRSGYNGCGPVLTPAPDANTLVNCDRCCLPVSASVSVSAGATAGASAAGWLCL